MNDATGILIGMALGVIVVYGIDRWTKSVIDTIPQHKINQIFDAIFGVEKDIKK